MNAGPRGRPKLTFKDPLLDELLFLQPSNDLEPNHPDMTHQLCSESFVIQLSTKDWVEWDTESRNRSVNFQLNIDKVVILIRLTEVVDVIDYILSSDKEERQLVLLSRSTIDKYAEIDHAFLMLEPEEDPRFRRVAVVMVSILREDLWVLGRLGLHRRRVLRR
ncbi:MAG: hypothetical protein Q9219_007651 [cf. Caloplaca sp. 3 TL-2023]